MAARYWISGGTGNTNSTTNWSTSSGGVSGATVPTSTDDAIWDSNSGVGTVTVNAVFSVLSASFIGFTGTLAGSASSTVAGDFTLSTGMTLTYTGTLNINNTSTITSAGKTLLGNLTLTGNFTFTLVDDCVVQAILTLTAGGGGTQTINGNSITAYSLTAANGTSRIITGTTNLIINAPTTGTINVTSALNNNVTINAAGTVTVTALTLYGGTFTTTTSGVTGTLLTCNGSVTLDIGNVYFNTISYGSLNSITYSGDVNCIGTMTVDVAGSISIGSYNNKFRNSSGVLVGSLVYNGTNTHVVGGDMEVVNLQFGTAGNSPTINGSTISVAGNLTVTNVTNGPSGTTNIILNGTGTWNHTSTGYIGNNITINTSGTTTIGATINYRTGTLTYTSGTIINNNTLLTLSSTCTLNVFPIVFVNINVTFTGNITLESPLVYTSGMTLPNLSVSFTGGTAAFTGGTLSMTTLPTVNRTLTLSSGRTYHVTGMNILGSTNTIRYIIQSNFSGNMAKLTLAPGASQNISYTNGIDIDSSLGQTIYSFNGVLNNTINWNILTYPQQNNFVFQH